MATTRTATTEHIELARLWVQYNGQRGTSKQVERALRTPGLTVENLTRMLTDRGILPEQFCRECKTARVYNKSLCVDCHSSAWADDPPQAQWDDDPDCAC